MGGCEDLGGSGGGDGPLAQAGWQEPSQLGYHGGRGDVLKACFKEQEPRDERADLVGVQK